MASIGHEQDHPSDTQVALLQVDLAFERLDIIESSLRLDDRGPPGSIDDGVCAPPIALDRDRNLRAPIDGVGQASLKPSKESEVALVADRVSEGVQGDIELEPEHRCHLRSQLDGHRVRLTALRSPDRGVRHAKSSTEFTLTDGGGMPRGQEAVGRACNEVSAPPRASISRAFVERHFGSLATGPYPRISWRDRLLGTRTCQSTNIIAIRRFWVPFGATQDHSSPERPFLRPLAVLGSIDARAPAPGAGALHADRDHRRHTG